MLYNTHAAVVLTHLTLDIMAADIFKCIFWNRNVIIKIQISTKIVLKGSTNNKSALGQVMAWRRPDDPTILISCVHEWPESRQPIVFRQ